MSAFTLHFMCSYEAVAEHLQQCAEFLPLGNRGLGTLAVTVLPIPFACEDSEGARRGPGQSVDCHLWC